MSELVDSIKNMAADALLPDHQLPGYYLCKF